MESPLIEPKRGEEFYCPLCQSMERKVPGLVDFLHKVLEVAARGQEISAYKAARAGPKTK